MILSKNILDKLRRYLALSASLIFFFHFLILGIYSIYPSFADSFAYLFFHLGYEDNLPTLFSSFLFLFLSFLSFYSWHSFRKIQWVILSAVFLFLSFDDFFGFHEHLTDITRESLATSGVLFFAWVIPYGILLFLLAWVFAPFIFRMKKENRFFVITGAVVFVFGALGLEMIGGALYESGLQNGLGYMLVSSFEEIFEITGLLIAIKGVSGEAIRT